VCEVRIRVSRTEAEIVNLACQPFRKYNLIRRLNLDEEYRSGDNAEKPRNWALRHPAPAR
jgi:hypothetical protein